VEVEVEVEVQVEAVVASRRSWVEVVVQVPPYYVLTLAWHSPSHATAGRLRRGRVSCKQKANIHPLRLRAHAPLPSPRSSSRDSLLRYKVPLYHTCLQALPYAGQDLLVEPLHIAQASWMVDMVYKLIRIRLGVATHEFRSSLHPGLPLLLV
jgi:hypothetical protein